MIPIDESIVDRYAELHAWSLAGHKLPHNDLWIAATALTRTFPLVSCDRHFNTIADYHPLDHIHLARKP